MKYQLTGFTREDRDDFGKAAQAMRIACGCIDRIWRRDVNRKGPYSLLCWLDWIEHVVDHAALNGCFEVDEEYCGLEENESVKREEWEMNPYGEMAESRFYEEKRQP